MKILAADDDLGMREFYAALLGDAGYEVETVSDGASAMDRSLDFKPDLVILDVDMPTGGGERVFALLRRVLQLGVPVIFVTGLPERAQPLALAHTQVSIFQKPVKGEELLREIRRLLKM